MLSVTIRITNLDVTQERLSAIKTALSDMTDVMESLAMKLVTFYENTVFESRGGAIDEPWADLKDATQVEKDRKWPGRGILVRTGELQRGFTKEVSPNRLFITNESNHFIFHQLGTSGGPGRGHNIPARKMLAITPTIEETIREDIKAAVHAKIEATKV